MCKNVSQTLEPQFFFWKAPANLIAQSLLYAENMDLSFCILTVLSLQTVDLSVDLSAASAAEEY
jgi:hypothetical protein